MMPAASKVIRLKALDRPNLSIRHADRLTKWFVVLHVAAKKVY